MRNGFTPEETQAILAEHYPWALKGNDMSKFKCVECDFEDADEEDGICQFCAEALEAEDDKMDEEDEE
jgi:hypothetical protein